ncbi:MAG: hypothetical protein HW404_2035, partial [Anaerolineales bacterium]|nr:BTAD protein [Anaerolineales bacterium]MBM2844198.1 hypothetical protein [Anaerolineales bacterium]
GQIAQAENVLDRAHRAVGPQTDPKVRALLENASALVAYYKGDHDGVLARTAATLELIGSEGDRGVRAHALSLRASVLASVPGGLPEAEKLADVALALLKEGKDNLDRANALRLRGYIHSSRGRISQAAADFSEAYRLVRDEAPALSLSSHLNNLAFGLYLLGQYDVALQQYSQALREARLVGSDLREAMILFGMADVYNDVGLAIQAAELYGEGLSVATRIDSSPWIIYGCVRTATLYRRRGLPEVSREWLKRARHLTGPRPRHNVLAVEEALALVDQQPAAARAYLDEILAFPEGEVDAPVRAMAWIGKVRATLGLGDLEGARAVLEEALAWTGPREQDQVIAAELLNDEELRRTVVRLLPTHPVVGVVLNRVEAMLAFERVHSAVREEVIEQPARLEVKALGGGSILLGSATLRTTKPQLREVLYYLIDHRTVTRDEFGEIFWPASPPGKRNANIHMAIHSLRRWVGRDLVESDGGTYQLSPSLEVKYDVASFRRARGIALALPGGDPRRFFALTEAVNSYTGEFLPEVASDWAAERRRELETQYLEVLSAYGEEALTRDQPQRAVEHIRRGLAIDPYRDDLNAQYLEALGRLGRRSEVVTHYHRYTSLLETDLGLDPPREVRDLYTRLIR